MLLSVTFEISFLPLLIVMAIAWLVPIVAMLFRLDKLPTVILEIIAGYFVGKYLLGIIPSDGREVLEFLSLTGFIFLMFLSGLEIDTDQIRSAFPRIFVTRRFVSNPFIIGSAMFIVTLLLSYLLTMAASQIIEINNLWYFSLILVTSSVGVIMPVLKNRGENSTRFGQMIIIAAAIADIVSIILFTFTAYILEHGFQIQILYIVFLFGLFYLFYRLGLKVSRIRLFKRLVYQLSHAASQIRVRGTLLVIMVFVVMAQYIDKEVVLLGAFIAGILLSIFFHKGRSLLLIKLDALGFGFFIPVFFVMVGAHFDPAALHEFDNSLVPFLLYLVAALYVVKIVPSFFWTRLFGIKRSISGGILLSSRLSLIIAASKIGLDLGIISPGINACFIIMAVVTCLISPTVYNFLSPSKKTPSEKTVIVGGSSTGVLLARRLKINERHSIIVENRIERVNEIKSKGLNVVYGDGFDLKIYDQLKLQPDNHVVVLTESEQKNISICQLLRNKRQHERLVTKATSLANEQTLKNLEVEFLDVKRVIATTIENLILRPSAYHALIESFENYNIEEIKITNPHMDGRQVKELAFHKNGSLVLLKRQEQMEIPHGDTFFKLGDVVTVIGTDPALADFREKFDQH